MDEDHEKITPEAAGARGDAMKAMKSWMANGSYSAGFCAEIGWGWWRWGIRYQTDYHASDFEHGILRIGLGWWQLVYFVPDRWICRFRDLGRRWLPEGGGDEHAKRSG